MQAKRVNGQHTILPILGKLAPIGIISCMPVCTKGITIGTVSASRTNLLTYKDSQFKAFQKKKINYFKHTLQSNNCSFNEMKHLQIAFSPFLKYC